ncbi:peptidoglycan-associated lipoprotein Pal [Dongia mobilis]|jgi:peptidoglycan-associated lipoprotein|uniref:peptidoglycan-associated lipoprotein Pal n=1 Tax=Dongia sp. TaxID=1977262 RepID=UPI0026ED9122
MFRNSVGNWRLMMAAAVMLGLAACGNDSSKAPATADPVQTIPGPIVDNVPEGVPPGSDVEFSQIVGNTVLFATDAHDLASEAQTILQRQAGWLLQYPAWTAVIKGHADERGTREYNLALGERRAESVRAYLIALGVDSARLQTISYGKEQPICGEANETCWQGNRRAITALNP